MYNWYYQKNIKMYREIFLRQLFCQNQIRLYINFDLYKYYFLLKLCGSFVYYLQKKFIPKESIAWQKIFKFFLYIKLQLNRRYFSKKSTTVLRKNDSFIKWKKRKDASALELLMQCRNSYKSCSLFYGFLLPIPCNSKIEDIIKTIDSMKNQTYFLFSTSISIDNNISPDLFLQIRESISNDDRFSLTKKDSSYKTAFSSIEADFVICTKVGDWVSPNFLYEIDKCIRNNGTNEIIYTDLLKNPNIPWFKPKSWSPHLLLSVNILSHAAIKRELINKVGEFDSSFGLAEEWDLDFRCSENTNNIDHICKILYSENSEIDLFLNWENISRLISNHFRRIDIHNVDVSLHLGRYIKVEWETAQPLISIIIPSKNHQPLINNCIDSIINRTNYRNYEILIVDNNSDDENTLAYYEKIRKIGNIRIINYREKFNYSKAINIGSRESYGEYLLFLNNDVEIINSEWLNEMLRWAMMPDVGIVGAKLLYPDNTIQHAGLVIGLKGYIDHLNRGAEEHEENIFGSVDWYRDCSAVTGACQLMRKKLYQELNGYNEKFELVFSDVDICIRAMEKYYNLYTPYSVLYHKENTTRGQGEPIADLLLGKKILQKFNNIDPFYNPNLLQSSYPTIQ